MGLAALVGAPVGAIVEVGAAVGGATVGAVVAIGGAAVGGATVGAVVAVGGATVGGVLGAHAQSAKNTKLEQSIAIYDFISSLLFLFKAGAVLLTFHGLDSSIWNHAHTRSFAR